MNKLKLIMEMMKWPLAWIDLRLYTAYGSKYYFYIMKHPLMFIRDFDRYLKWCINFDKYR